MRRSILSLVCLSAAAVPAYGRQSRTSEPRVRTMTLERTSDGDRAVLGITMSSTGKRDTLGVLVQSVTPGGPAEKAGIEEGDRIAAIGGVSLKVPREDAGDDEMAGAIQSRLRRELRMVKAGDEVSLELWAGGRSKMVKVKSVSADALSPARAARELRANANERAAIGISLSATGNKRDTAGVFVAGVSDGGPAEKSGIVEGDRLSAINGVDLRVSKDDAGDRWAANARVQRLQRTIASLKPGQSVDLALSSGGRTRTVKVTTVRASELPQANGFAFNFGGDGFVMPPLPPLPPMAPSAPRGRVYRDGDGWSNFDAIAPEVRRNLEIELPRAMERARAAIGQMKIRVGRRII
jgi:serine protease Do